ncbi:ribosome recycling factor [Lacticaseibacillus thailandensis]|uniref:ribosome recycling factor n=1 Tax=Lacticaseibacillus thailandensis TaxID=381741 RepID=UPI0006D15420|nr:ribosome recycling factor [Lacticaseibacillus thailandensis]
MANAAINDAKDRMDKSLKALSRDLGSIRAGRANASLLTGINVDYYGAPTPLTQMSAITIPEPRVLQISPYDESSLKNIETALLKSDLGINPQNDGSVIRLVIPQLTTETRQELAKEVGKHAEQGKIAIRNVRREAMDSLKKQEKDGDISEDELRRLEKDVQKITDDATKSADDMAAAKEKEITEASGNAER